MMVLMPINRPWVVHQRSARMSGAQRQAHGYPVSSRARGFGQVRAGADDYPGNRHTGNAPGMTHGHHPLTSP